VILGVKLDDRLLMRIVKLDGTKYSLEYRSRTRQLEFLVQNNSVSARQLRIVFEDYNWDSILHVNYLWSWNRVLIADEII
jgi:hypothetical protein